MKEDPKRIEWAINGIKELEFFVDEELELGPSFDFNYTVEVIPDPPENKLHLTILARYMKKESSEIFMRGKVKTTYLIKDLSSLSKKLLDNKDAVDLPDQLWIAFFSIAFTHARAILAKSSAGTKYSHMLLPAINPEKEFKKLFGKFINEQSSI